MTEELVCSLCNASFSSKQSLTKHIHQHLFYRKYECGSCADLFYTDEEREAHCKKKGHFHTFGMRVSSYCELYVNQFLKDIEHIATYGIDKVVIQRSKANLACDTAISKLPRKSSPVKKKHHSVSPSRRQDSPRASLVSEVHEQDDSNEADEYLEEPSTSTRKSKESRKRIRMPSDDWMRIEVDNSTSISPATQILSEALRTNAPEVRCTICKAMTSSDYVLRKHHVSSMHMPKDHTESDYVEILSAMMQKAYPTMTYNDLQCQIGGCRKEYKCQSARRNHVLRIHFQNELSCPIKACSFRSNDFPRINTHLKEDHGLANGYQSISSATVRDQFNADRAKHNHRLTTLVQLAFPCNIPEVVKSSHKADVSFSGATVQSLITRIREKDRKFQTTPPNPLRLRSPSTSSDSDSSETEKAPKSPKRHAVVCVNKSSITVSKDMQTSSASSPHSRSLLSKHERTKRDRGHREEVNPPSSPSTLENCDGDKNEVDSSCQNSDKELDPHKENEEPGSDVDSMWNNAASEKSESEASESDDVQLVACVPGPTSSSTKQTEIEEVVLEDDDGEVRAAVKSPSAKTAVAKPKQPEYRTLSISGVSVRTDKVNETFFRPATSPGFPRTLPISGVSIRADGTPIRPPTESYRRSFTNLRHSTPQRHTSRASEQYERRRELARRKIDLAEQKHMQRRKNISKVAQRYSHTFSESEAPFPFKKSQRGFGANASTRSPFKRPASEGSIHSRGPSYIVPKVKREASSHSDRSPRPSNTWRGKIKRAKGSSPPSSSKAPAPAAPRSISTASPSSTPKPPPSVGKDSKVTRSSTITARPSSVRNAPAPPTAPTPPTAHAPPITPLVTQPTLPLERERNLKRKKGFDYLLVNIEFQKGKKFGLGMVHTENRVLVNKVDDGSMCSDSIKYLDRICDVEGVPVTDKELCKKQIVKVLKKDQKVSLAIERPVSKDRIRQVQDLLKRLETQPPSVVLEVDVRDIIARYNQRLQKGEIAKKAHSAMKKKDHAAAKVSLDPGIPTIPIGMDNPLLQEDLEKVPVKTYETSLARLQNQNDAPKSGVSITTMLNQQEQTPQSPILQSSPVPPPEIPAMPALSVETQNPAPQALVPVNIPEQKLTAIVAPAHSPAPGPMDHQANYSSDDKFAMQLKDFNHTDNSNGGLYDAFAELDNIEEAEQLSVRLQYGINPFTKRFKLLFERLVNRFAK